MQSATRTNEPQPVAPRADDATPHDQALEDRIQQIGRDLFARSLAAAPTLLQPQWWQQRLLEWAMHDDGLRTQLFRFIDVLPSLSSDRDIAAHLAEYLLKSPSLPAALEHALGLGAPDSLRARIGALAARRNVRQIARRFIAGQTLSEAIDTVQRLRRQHMAYTLDVLGEAITSESLADEYARRYLDLIDGLSGAAQTWPAVPQIDGSAGAPLPRVNVSLKLSALYSQFDAAAPARCADIVGQRLRPILRLARERGAFVHVDMEDYQYKDLVLEIFRSILLEDEFREFAHVGIVIQAYLEDAEADLRTLIDWVARRGAPIVVRLVKGAYWDSEVVRAAQHGWPCPVFRHKWETDAMFERLTRLLIEHHTLVRPAIASHNIRSLAHAIALAEQRRLVGSPEPAPSDFELQMLFGMGDALKAAVVQRGLRLRIYAPYGPLIPGMAYLIRRLLENTSNDSFLRQSFSEHMPIDELLAPPTVPPVARETAPDVAPRGAMAFANEPLTDFSIAAKREAMAAVLHEVREHACGATYTTLIGGESVHTNRILDSVDPSRTDRIVGRIVCAAPADADRAVAAARAAWPAWRDTAAEERAAMLTRIAEHMRQRRFELAAWIVIETGKPWREADADVAEAIDYCEFYACEMCRLTRHPRQHGVPGEENVLVYEPRGVAAIIAPWNFPLAILTGMTTAALVAGNTVVVKPAEQSSVIAAKFFEMCVAAGCPPAVANFVPGIGEEVGAHLVTHPDVDLIAFTGSRDVGLHIIEAAARTPLIQRNVKRVVAEMGGKNAIIVDSDADLDDAVRGVTASAFGYAGQKCSACSRVIVLSAVHEVFVKRLVDSTRSLCVGPADDPATMVGPLIDAAARERVLRYIELGEREAELVCRVEHHGERGYFVGPVIFDRVPRHAALAQEEIFGPVLAAIPAASFEEALAIANDTAYGLTGGLYSRSPARIERAKREFRVGNLYINRPITGAMVDRQPFGGLKLSGIGSKAGGSDYLLQFCEPRTITENTVRHGFAPNLQA